MSKISILFHNYFTITLFKQLSLTQKEPHKKRDSSFLISSLLFTKRDARAKAQGVS